MAYLPLANILHHKLRSLLNALGIGIGICMLVTLSGLSRGSLGEVADRWESVDADLIVFPRGWGDGASARSGAGLSDRYADRIATACASDVERIVPVFTWTIRLAEQDQMVAGVEPGDWATLTGGRELSQGRLFDPEGKFRAWIERKLLAADESKDDGDEDELLELTQQDLSQPGRSGLEMVIDERLAAAGGFRLDQTVRAANHDWKIVGIVPAGVMTRAFVPRRTAQYLFGSGDITRSTLLFVKLRRGVDVGPAGRRIAELTRQDVVPLGRYRGMLIAKFGIIFRYVDAVNGIALAIAFLFVMVTLYTMVLQRTREIAILKSFGASKWYIVRGVLGESVLLTFAGTAVGVGLSFLAAWLIQTVSPLLTVTIELKWIVIAPAAAGVGAILSALYPAWRATRVDMAAALALE